MSGERAEQIYYKSSKAKRSEYSKKQIDNIIEDAKQNLNIIKLYKYDYSTLKLHEERIVLLKNECFPLIDFLKEKCDLE